MRGRVRAGVLGIAAVLVTGGVVAYALQAPAVRSTSEPRGVQRSLLIGQLAEWRLALHDARDPYYALINKILDLPKSNSPAQKAALASGRDAQRYALACLHPIRRNHWEPPFAVKWNSPTKLTLLQSRCTEIKQATRNALAVLRTVPMGVTRWWGAEQRVLEPKLRRLAAAAEAVEATCELRLQELERVSNSHRPVTPP